MKNFLTPLFVFLLLSPAYGRNEESFKQDGYEFTLWSDTSVVISDADFGEPIPLTGDGTLVLPTSVTFEGKTYLVERIGRYAFAGRGEIKHLVIGEGVTDIEPYAFYRCSGLESIHFPSTFEGASCYDSDGIFLGCSNLCRITVDERNEEFDSRDGCNGLIVTESNTLMLGCRGTEIPSSVTTIGPRAFEGCQDLESIALPEGVRKIEYCAFRNCTNLKEIVLPSTLDSIGGSLFEGCASLESIRIPRNVTKVSSRVFQGCYSLKEVVVDERNRTFDSRRHCNAIIDSAQDTIVAGCGASVILEGIKGIGAEAFSDTGIRSIYIPKSVQKIGEMAFSGCQFCNTITVHPKNPVFDSRDNCNAIIETATDKLVQGCSVTNIPGSVKELGNFSFLRMILPPCLVIPEGVEVIGKYVFSRFCGIERVQLPSSLKHIKSDAFMGCNMLYYVDMSRCSPSIEDFAFSHCKNLHLVDFSPTPSEDISNLAFSDTPFGERVDKILERSK